MTDKEQIIECADCTSKCNCFYNFLNYRLEQLALKTHEYQNLADILRDTDIYSEVCGECRDDILLYSSISNRTSYTDNEVDRITLRKIIDELKDKTQECEELKRKVELMMDCPDCKVDEYKKALDEIEEYVKSQFDGFGSDVYAMNKVAINKILDIIDKAKGEEKCQ